MLFAAVLGGVLLVPVLAPGSATAAVKTVAAVCVTSAPKVISLTINSGSFDVRSKAQVVTFTVTAVSTVADVDNVVVWASSPKFSVLHLDLVKVSGTAQNGTWSGSGTLPRGAVAGTWTIDSLYVTDVQDGETRYNPKADGEPPTASTSSPKAERNGFPPAFIGRRGPRATVPTKGTCRRHSGSGKARTPGN